MTSKVYFPSPPPYNYYTTCERNAQLLFVEAAMPREEVLKSFECRIVACDRF